MDWQTLTTELASSIAWPVALIIILWILRNQIRALIRGIAIKNLRGSFLGMEFEAEFEERTEDLARRTKSITPPAEKSGDTAQGEFEVPDSLANAASGGVILFAWLIVEKELLRIAKLRDDFTNDRFQHMRIHRTLVEEGRISEDLAVLIEELRQLRNLAAHMGLPDTISEKSAQSYLVTATSLALVLQRVTA